MISSEKIFESVPHQVCSELKSMWMRNMEADEFRNGLTSGDLDADMID